MLAKDRLLQWQLSRCLRACLSVQKTKNYRSEIGVGIRAVVNHGRD